MVAQSDRTSATRFTESKLVGCATEFPGQSRSGVQPSRPVKNTRACSLVADRGTFPWAVVKRPVDRRNFPSGRGQKTCRSRIFHSDQSEKTCRSRIFPSGRGEETCRSRNFPTSRIPQQTFVLVLDRASTVTTVDSDVSDRGKHRGSLKYAQNRLLGE